MKFKIFLVLVICVTITLVVQSYISNFADNVFEVVEISDKDIAIANGDVNEKGEILISDSDMDTGKISISTVGEGSTKTIKNQDDSTTTISIDGFGNKTETKRFNNDSRIKMIKVTTSNTGDKRVLVYSRTGKVENIPYNLADSVLQLTPDKVANAAGIYETREDKERRFEDMELAKKDRIRKANLDEFEAIRNSMPKPVYRENNQNNESQPTEKRERISENLKPLNEQ